MALVARPLACEIAAYSEEELDKILEENGRIISVRDPENIAPAFIQRLRDKVRSSREVTHSRAVDLCQVAARLRVLSDNTEQSTQTQSGPPTPPLPTQQEQDLEDLQAEIEAYPALVEAGGRPPYPFHLLNEIFHQPEQYLEDPQYHDIILFWRGRVLREQEKTPLCACHLLWWNRFRRLQRIIRQRSIQSEWTLISAADWDTWEAFIERYGQKDGSWGFPEYTERIKKRLSKYGFTRPFQLESDLSRQDSITTWIEYLAYEYWFYDQHASYIKRFQRKHDEAWKKLVDSGVLRPGESYDIVCDIESVFKDAAENEQAKRAVQSTTAALLAAEVAAIKPYASQDVRDADERRLSVAQAARDKAEAEYQSLMRRCDAITDFCQQTKGCRNANDDAERHLLLLRWIKQQIPLIECESRSVGSCIVHAERGLNSKSLKVIVAEASRTYSILIRTSRPLAAALQQRWRRHRQTLRERGKGSVSAAAAKPSMCTSGSRNRGSQITVISKRVCQAGLLMPREVHWMPLRVP
ncbi:hypothetical protein LTR35_017643 [Friedmanniomyces endolithicus]|nr:hypothetical protein LTR35_017643 [Friedmanniomyces endolithicus]KAK0971973.1 hypothetical protein LTR54_017677 [Friedmanniomyces endolithicus]